MTDEQFDTALIRAAMAQAELHGWRRVSVVEAAREAGLPLDRARLHYRSSACILLRLGMLADQAALIDDGSEGTARERLFDMLMRRFDVLQQYREGVRAVLSAAPYDPGLALMLANETRASMAWMAQAAGLDTQGMSGAISVAGLTAIWLQAARAWERDEEPGPCRHDGGAGSRLRPRRLGRPHARSRRPGAIRGCERRAGSRTGCRLRHRRAAGAGLKLRGVYERRGAALSRPRRTRKTAFTGGA